jgi:hypothetical protein
MIFLYFEFTSDITARLHLSSFIGSGNQIPMLLA